MLSNFRKKFIFVCYRALTTVSRSQKETHFTTFFLFLFKFNSHATFSLSRVCVFVLNKFVITRHQSQLLNNNCYRYIKNRLLEFCPFLLYSSSGSRKYQFFCDMQNMTWECIVMVEECETQYFIISHLLTLRIQSVFIISYFTACMLRIFSFFLVLSKKKNNKIPLGINLTHSLLYCMIRLIMLLIWASAHTFTKKKKLYFCWWIHRRAIHYTLLWA